MLEILGQICCSYCGGFYNNEDGLFVMFCFAV